MRYSLFALAAASTALASPHMHRRGHGAHANVFARSAVAPAPAEDCVCSTYVTSRVYEVTVPVAVPTGSVAVPNYGGSSSGVPEDSVVTVVPVYESDADATTTVPVSEVAYETSISYVDSPSSIPVAASSSIPVVASSSAPVAVPEVPAPTPAYSTFTEPGTYTIPATTITISETEVVCNAEQTTLTAGDNTYGGVTTVVPAPTTVTVPYATVEVEDETTTSKIVETVYVCPTAGTYTVAPTTSHVEEDTPVTYVVPTTIAPGTYTAPEQTVTVTKTNQVVVCPYETTAPEVSSSAIPEVVSSAVPEAVSSAVSEVSSSAAAVVSETPKVETPKVEVEEESSEDEEEVVPKTIKETIKDTVEKVKDTVKDTVETVKDTVEKVTSSDGLWSISYSPYEDNGLCRSAEGVASDIADIASKGFKNVRVYGTECSTLENVGAACKVSGLKMIVGVFIEGDVSSGDSQIKDIVAWKQWDLVEVIVIGNEAIFNGYTDGPGLAAYITKNKAVIQGAGYTGQFTTTDTLGAFQGDGVASALCSCLDIVGVNIQVFFDGGRTASEAGEFFASQVSDAKKVCPGKEVYVLEAGWPSAGDSNGNAITGKIEQKIAIEGMKKAAPGHISFFTYKNDLWKATADHIEANFGCGDLF